MFDRSFIYVIVSISVFFVAYHAASVFSNSSRNIDIKIMLCVSFCFAGFMAIADRSTVVYSYVSFTVLVSDSGSSATEKTSIVNSRIAAAIRQKRDICRIQRR